MSFARYPSLENRVVFITGGGSGIGAAMVEAFADQGARVAFVDILRGESEALDRAARRRARKAVVPALRSQDLRELEGAMAEAAAKLGPIGALVNNAANDQRQPSDEVSEGRLGPHDGGQPQTSILRRANRAPFYARAWRRGDRQPFLDRVDERG